ncbi:MAG: ABC transporter permease [Bacillota bacterium]
MLNYVARRVLLMVPLLIGVSIINFGIIKMAPGDPLMAMAIDPQHFVNITPEEQAKLKEALGLNEPVHKQYLNWAKEVINGNLGISLISRRPVKDLIKERLPATISLGATALIISILIALPIGIVSAVKQYSLTDYIATLYAFIGVSIPAFWLGLMVVYLFSLRLGWFPTGGRGSFDVAPGIWPMIVDRLHHFVLPVVTLSASSLAGWMRYQRTSMVETFKQDYVRTARAKGLSELTVIVKHAWHNSLIPIVTLLGFSLTNLIGGAYIVEVIFSWPGMGRLGVEAIFRRDYPLVMGVGLVSSFMVMLGNLLADILYAFVDPRIRY